MASSPRAPRSLADSIGRGEAVRILLLCAMLFALAFVYFFQTNPTDHGEVPIERTGAHRIVLDPAIVEKATPDPALMASVRDASRQERLSTEGDVLRHLLEKSIDVSPAVARALGLPDRPVPLVEVRANPGRHRGKYLWYEGYLERLRTVTEAHPVRGFKMHEAQLRLPEGDRVMLVFSVPPDAALATGAYVRAEGFFLKLLNRHFPDEIEGAALLVGPELFAAHKVWDPVTALDPEILAQIDDGQLGPDRILIEGREGDIAQRLPEAQDVPLWHMASYARERERKTTDAELRAVPAFAERSQWPKLMYGEIQKGTPLRLLGSFVFATTFPARTNPAGIDHWTEVWIQCRDLGGRLVPIWVPKEIAGTWRRGNSVVAHGLLFKRLRYETVGTDGQPTDRMAPVFVAADIHPFTVLPNPSNRIAGYVILGLCCVTILGIAVIVFRDGRNQRQREAEQVERRRRRRQLEETAASS